MTRMRFLTPDYVAQWNAKKAYSELIRTAGFPSKPDGSKMVYRTAVKTGVIFEGYGPEVGRPLELCQ